MHPRSAVHGIARFATPHIGNFNIGVLSRDYRGTDSERLTVADLTYSRSITKYLSLSAGIRHSLEGTDTEDTFFIGLTFFPRDSEARSYIDSADYHYNASEREGNSHKINIQKSAGSVNGTGYSFNAGRKENSTTSVTGRYLYRNESSIVTASLSHPSPNNTGGRLGVSGSIAALDNNLYFGRPITDGFAVVELDEVDGFDDVSINHNKISVGRIEPGGSLVVPAVRSHQENELSISTQELPLDFISVDDKKYVQIGNRGGTSIRFTATRFTAVEGNIYLEAGDGEETELNALPLELIVNGVKRTGYIGRNGYFYIENLPPGEYVLRVLRFEGDCEARFSITESEKIVSGLGKIPCRPAVDEKNSSL